VRWSPQLVDKIVKSAGEDLPHIVADLEKGVAQLWHFRRFEKSAYVVTRLEADELVVVCFEGEGVAVFGPPIIEYAERHGLTIRAHISDWRLSKLLERLDFKFDHYVLKRAHNGRSIT
jgi:hypothetical protein